MTQINNINENIVVQTGQQQTAAPAAGFKSSLETALTRGTAPKAENALTLAMGGENVDQVLGFLSESYDLNEFTPEELISGVFSSKGRVKVDDTPKVVGNRNIAHAANNLQYFIDRKDGNKLYFGTPLEYSADYGAPYNYSAIGLSPSIDVSEVDTFGYECGDHVMGEYYIERGYTADKGWIYNDNLTLEYVGVEKAMELYEG